MNSYNVISENSDVALSAHLLVKMTDTGVDLAGASDKVCGSTLNDTLIDTAAAVAMRGAYPIHEGVLGNSTAVEKGDELDQGANGTIVKAAGGTKIGVARQSASGVGAIIEFWMYPA